MTKGVRPMDADRREVARKVEIQVLIKRGVDGIGRDGLQQRIAVRRRVGDDFGADIAGRARAVVDDELLAEPLRQRLADEARDDVGRQARRIADDDVHRPRRIIERRRAAWRQRQRGGARGQLQNFSAFHVFLPCQSALMPANFITLAHFSVSAAIKAR